MTLTIDVPDATLATLNERAKAEGRPVADLAVEAMVQHFGEGYDEDEFPLDDETVAKMRQGMAEIDAGQTISLEESRAQMDALLAARYRQAHK